MPDKLLKHGLLASEKIGGVPEFAELLFVRLILVTCHLGRCPWDPDWIRSHALPNRLRKRLTEIAAALESLRRARLVTRYTGHDGTPYLLIPNHGQRLRHAVRSPWPAPPSGPPDVDGQTFMALPGAAPEAPDPDEGRVRVGGTHFTSLLSSPERQGRRGEGKPVAASCPAFAPGLPGGLDPMAPAAAHAAELAAAFPAHDIAVQLRAATRYARKQRSDETAEITVDFFVRQWLPRAPKRRPASAAPASTAPAADPAAARAVEARLAEITAGPEPAPGTLEHALWSEARKSA